MNTQFVVGFRQDASDTWSYYGLFTSYKLAEDYADRYAGHEDGPGVDEVIILPIFAR